ncbi:MAG: PEP-CTERM sorting domain-containing protein [bacterium]|nr:PEP-CTERM sorting domain-containing protein [bacterium]
MNRSVKIYLMTVSLAVLLLIGLSQSVTAAPIVQGVGFVSGNNGFQTTGFQITNPGTYVAELIDDAFPEAFDFLGLTVNNASENFALLFSPGTMQFNVGAGQTGPFEANVVWDTADNWKLGQYRWSVAVIPEPTSMFLLGSGLVGLAALKAKRRKWQE